MHLSRFVHTGIWEQKGMESPTKPPQKFTAWTEQDQTDFCKHLLQRMCHHQHGQIDQFLGPMLQRDFISLLPSKIYSNNNICVLAPAYDNGFIPNFYAIGLLTEQICSVT
jgi:hypothetical protein